MSKSKRSKKEKKHKSRTKPTSNNLEDADGPVPLSRFFERVKSLPNSSNCVSIESLLRNRVLRWLLVYLCM